MEPVYHQTWRFYTDSKVTICLYNTNNSELKYTNRKVPNSSNKTDELDVEIVLTMSRYVSLADLFEHPASHTLYPALSR